MVIEVGSFSTTHQINKTGRINPSTTEQARTERFRLRVQKGRTAAGLVSTFEVNPQRTYQLTRNSIAFLELTPLRREVLELRFGEGLSQSKVAEILGRKPRAISKIERNAMKKLREEEMLRAEGLLKRGKVPLSETPFLTSLEKQVLELYYNNGLSLRKVGMILDHDIKRVHEIKQAALYKIAKLYSFD